MAYTGAAGAAVTGVGAGAGAIVTNGAHNYTYAVLAAVLLFAGLVVLRLSMVRRASAGIHKKD